LHATARAGIESLFSATSSQQADGETNSRDENDSAQRLGDQRKDKDEDADDELEEIADNSMTSKIWERLM
jgi:hypothetical protein